MEQPPAQPVAWYDAVMVFGGSMNTHEEDRHPWLRHEKERSRRRSKPSSRSSASARASSSLSRGRRGAASDVSEIGWYEVELTPEAAGDPIFARLPQRFPSHQWHSYCSTSRRRASSWRGTTRLPPGLPGR